MINIIIILLLISSILIFFKLYILSIIVITVSIVIIILTLKKKTVINYKKNSYLITHNALKNPYLKIIIKQCLYDANFILSDEIVKQINVEDTTVIADNIVYLKKRGVRIEKIEKSIKSLFKYAFENNVYIIMSGERSAKNFSKIFNIRCIDLSQISSIKDNKIEINSEITFIITKSGANISEGYVLEDIRVFCENVNLKKGGIYRGYIKSIIDIKGKKQIIVGSKKHEK